MQGEENRGWVSIESRNLTPLPFFISSPPTEDGPYDDKKVSEGSESTTRGYQDLSSTARQHTPVERSLLPMISRQYTPLSLGLSKYYLAASRVVEDDEATPRHNPLPVKHHFQCQTAPKIFEVLLELNGPYELLHYMPDLADALALLASTSSIATALKNTVERGQYQWVVSFRSRFAAEGSKLLSSVPPNLHQAQTVQLTSFLGPRMWGSGLTPSAVSTSLQIEALGPAGFFFGLVPEHDWAKDAVVSLQEAVMIDEYGRLHRDGKPVCLYGSPIQEGDTLSVVIRSKFDIVHGFFALNGQPLDDFQLPKHRSYATVLFMKPSQPGMGTTRLRVPRRGCKTSAGQRAKNLIIKCLKSSALELQLSALEIENMTIAELKRRVAAHFAARSYCRVSQDDVLVWIGARVCDDTSALLTDLVHSSHLQDISISLQ
eukprot:TRINITY_DN8513_c0_g1_i1.p1 TRINITY_DN8513_c0_g1~~TRINITY_DN8513_c0_g1_i1.p1  ORF type:complete len:431 (+),score=82.49 TRINITY_DN8513_c0_g1_i1:124-1416(+)